MIALLSNAVLYDLNCGFVVRRPTMVSSSIPPRRWPVKVGGVAAWRGDGKVTEEFDFASLRVFHASSRLAQRLLLSVCPG